MIKKQKKTPERVTIADQLRAAIEASGQSVYAIAKAAEIAQPVLHRFSTGERDLTLMTADKLIEHFGLELTPKRKRGV